MTDADIVEAHDAFEKGWAMAILAKKFGISRYLLYAYVRGARAMAVSMKARA